ncbi:MAG: lysophospholipid acyltransferase family protein [Bacteroidales bacterium]|nr:lysophospholipid acyltransferase family protein [Bacteroidales bacterium]
MGRWLLKYLLLPLAWLPLGVHYAASTLSAPLIHRVLRYRLKIVRGNLQRSFPDKNVAELRHIEHLYYRHLADLLFEGIYNLRATPPLLLKHYRLVNRQIVDKYYEQGRSVVLMSSHYNNWEYMVSSLNFQLRHHGVGVGKPLSDKGFGYELNRRRTRYGTEVVDQTNVRDVMSYYHQHGIPVAYMMLSDQSPSNPHRSYWTTFLHQDTAFLYGSEHFARKYDMPVIYYEVQKVRRGHYEVRFSLITDKPNSQPEGSITETYTKKLEQLITSAPQYWLWSHRRWKLKK